MRVNIYAEEITDRVEIIEKETSDGKFTGLRFYLYLPVTERAFARDSKDDLKQHQGPFIHREGDDDSAAVTFWGKKKLRDVLVKAIAMLDAHHEGKDPSWDLDQDRMLSPTALSNLYTMGCTAEIDSRQNVPGPYTIPPQETRELRAKLILEEVIETVKALGFTIHTTDYHDPIEGTESLSLKPDREPNLEEIIDGCCDTQYVTVGTLCACGVSDNPHMSHVNECNNAKFPNGKVIMHKTISGKYGKPEGWESPNHKKIGNNLSFVPNLAQVSQGLREGKLGIGIPPEHKEHGNKQSGQMTNKELGA